MVLAVFVTLRWDRRKESKEIRIKRQLDEIEGGMQRVVGGVLEETGAWLRGLPVPVDPTTPKYYMRKVEGVGSFDRENDRKALGERRDDVRLEDEVGATSTDRLMQHAEVSADVQDIYPGLLRE